MSETFRNKFFCRKKKLQKFHSEFWSLSRHEYGPHLHQAYLRDVGHAFESTFFFVFLTKRRLTFGAALYAFFLKFKKKFSEIFRKNTCFCFLKNGCLKYFRYFIFQKKSEIFQTFFFGKKFVWNISDNFFFKNKVDWDISVFLGFLGLGNPKNPKPSIDIFQSTFFSKKKVWNISVNFFFEQIL